MSQHSVQNESICIIRLSSIGDVTHMLPIIHSIQKFRPQTHITWIIGKLEYKLVGDLANVEFIQFDKNLGLRAYADVLKQLKGRSFNILLACQVSLRANLLTALVKAKRKIGYDKLRAKDLHSLVVNEHIPPANIHVLDSFFQFLEKIGIEHKKLDWTLPISEEAKTFAQYHIPGSQTIVAISPCSSHATRNWTVNGYIQIANHAITKHNAKIVLLGGYSKLEKEYGEKIAESLIEPPINLVAKDTLKKLLAVLQRCTVLITPDSGPAHIATCVNTPVIALHAASNSRRSGPYLSQPWCIDKYNEAAIKYCNKPATRLRWGTKIEKPGVMDLISAENVIMRLDQFIQQHER